MTWITAARLFDGERMVERPTVFIENGTIVDVGVTPPESAEVLDLGDATVLPGLVDCHQHLCFDGVGTLEEQVAGIDDDALVVRSRESALRALRAGITTLRDLGDRNYSSLGLRGDPALPTIQCAGPPLTVVGGHCWYLGGECDGLGGLVRSVNERADRGCDVVKIMVSGGALTPTFPMWQSQFSTEEVRTVVETAHARGLPVAGHCHGVDAIRTAVEARVDSIEHCTFFTTSGGSEPPPDLIEKVAASGIVVSATLGQVPGLPVPARVADNLPIVRAALAEMHGRGATIVAGSDGGISPVKPHDVLPHALGDFISLGMTAAAGLRALTRTAADVLGLGDRKGRVASGYDADLLAVEGNPLTDATALTSVRAVWVGGRRAR